eukprot:maker-scaffold275_size226830-snap-gene-1.31 protein:Tk00637 transcript:maker-scaffold275_size226830-snap-gene-1.31-mRNA-1 annotation:"tdrd7"
MGTMGLNEEQEKKLKEVKSLLRSLLISAKDGVELNYIIKEYKQMVGTEIPYRILGYASLEEFLEQITDTCRVARTARGFVLYAISTADTYHITQMVARQKSIKRKPKPLGRRPMQRGTWIPNHPMAYGGRGGGRGSYGGPKHNGGSYPNPGRLSGLPQYHVLNGGGRGAPSQSRRAGHRGIASGGGAGGRPLRPVNGDSRARMTNGDPDNTYSATHHDSGKAPPYKPRGGSNTRPVMKPVAPINMLPPPPCQFKLELERFCQLNNIVNVEFKTSKLGQKFISTAIVKEQRFQTFPHEFITPELAEDAASKLALDNLSLEGRLNHGGSKGPPKSPNQSSARSVTTRKSGTDHGRGCIDDALIDQVFEIVTSPNGVWSTEIDKEYAKIYNKALPKTWPVLLQEFTSTQPGCKLKVDTPIPDRYIICRNAPTECDEHTPVRPVSGHDQSTKGEGSNLAPKELVNVPSDGPNKEKKPPAVPPPIAYPSDDFWDVYVTNVNSTVNVFLRLLGKDYSEKYEALVTDMELFYYNDTASSTEVQPQIGRLYVAIIDSEVNRVEICEITGSYVTCFFIDTGEKEVVKVESLRELAPQFLELPIQSISVQLYGLEHLAESPSALVEVSTALQAKSFVAELVRRPDDAISMVIHDTSTNQDVNLNRDLLAKLSDVPPALELASSSSTHSSSSSGPTSMDAILPADLGLLKELVPAAMPDVGEYFDISIVLAASPSNFVVQPWRQGNEFNQLQGDINVFYSNPKNHRPVTKTDLEQDKFFAIRHEDKSWYRVKVTSMLDEFTASVRFVDFGDASMVCVDNFQLLWSQFRNLPMQAISAKLADIIPKDGGDWSADDCVWFSKRVVRKQFVSVIKDITLDDDEPANVKISVSLVDTDHPTDDKFIEKELVECGRAVELCV